MKVLGVVQWTTRDKVGSPIAGVRPLIELQKVDWRPIDAEEEFPSRGQIFWYNAQSAGEGTFIIFRAEPNPGQKDEFKVVEPKFAHEVIDLRRLGNEADIRAALISGIKITAPIGAARVLIWCAPSVLIGPVELTNFATGTVKLNAMNFARVPFFTDVQVKSVAVDGEERLLRVDESAPAGYVDWDDDEKVLRRALEAAIRVAKQAGHDTRQTKRQIEDAAKALAAPGLGLDASLDRYRLERALELLKGSDVVARCAFDLAELLRAHPAIKAALDKLSSQVQAEVEQSARTELEQLLAGEKAALRETKEAHARARSQLSATETELRKLEERLVEVQSQATRVASEAEAAVEARVRAAINRPLDLLGEVSVLRPFLGVGGSRAANTAVTEAPSRIDWSNSRGEAIKDRTSLRRTLTSAARARGVDPSVMLQIHAATAASLMPVAFGPKALAALAAYAHSICSGRLLVIHIAPNFLQVRDMDDVPGGGLLAATIAARDIDGISLAVLEGANRSPLEASLVPLLHLSDAGLSSVASARGLRLGATLVTGATTVPVTSQIWSHATAVYCEPSGTSSQTDTAPGDLSLSSEVLALGDVPVAVIDALIDTWPDCREVRPSLERLGSALTRLYEDEPRVSGALLHGIVLPYIATALSVEEQAEALSSAGDTDGSLASALRRLRKRLC